MTYTAEELAELRMTARELRGCGHTVDEIARALKVSQAEALRLCEVKAEGRTNA